MRLPRVQFTVRRMMAAVALAALGLGLWRWTHAPFPSPQARALELALSVPTFSHYEAAAIYQAALYREQVSPGTLTKVARLPKVQASRIDDDRPIPLSWLVMFTDGRSGKTFSVHCYFGLSSVNEFRAVVETGIQTARTSP